MRGVAVTGVGMTAFGKHPRWSITSLVTDSIVTRRRGSRRGNSPIGAALYDNTASGLLLCIGL